MNKDLKGKLKLNIGEAASQSQNEGLQSMLKEEGEPGSPTLVTKSARVKFVDKQLRASKLKLQLTKSLFVQDNIARYQRRIEEEEAKTNAFTNTTADTATHEKAHRQLGNPRTPDLHSRSASGERLPQNQQYKRQRYYKKVTNATFSPSRVCYTADNIIAVFQPRNFVTRYRDLPAA